MKLRVTLLALLAVAGYSNGQTYTWDGAPSGTGTSWNSATNWVGDTLPTGGANLLFNNVTGDGLIATPLSVSGNRTAGLITFDNVNGKLPAVLDVDTNGPGGSIARTLTINTGITLANYTGTVRFNATNNGTLTLSLGAANVTFEPQSGSTLILNTAIAGAGSGLTKAGTGTLTLRGENTYTGNTAITAGTLDLAADGSIGSSPTISVATAATFNVAAVSGGFILGGTAPQTLRGSGTVTGATTVAAGGTVFADAVGATATPLATGSVLFNDGGNLRVQASDGGAASNLTLTGASRLSATQFGRSATTGLIDVLVTSDGSLTPGNTYTRRVAAYTALQNLTEGATYTAADNVFTLTSPEFTVADGWQIRTSGGFVDITFSPVPEPPVVFAVGLVLAAAVAIRRLRPPTPAPAV